MSYIRCLSNPEGLYIWHDVAGHVAINHSMHPPLANPSFEDDFPIIRVPFPAFKKVCEKWLEGGRREASRGFVAEEVYIFTDTGKPVPAMPIEQFLEDNHPKRYAIRLSYKDEFVHLWPVTWQYVVESFHRQQSRLVGKDPAAVALGSKGGRKGGFARAAKLSPEQRRETARKAANARWNKKR